jgi:plastocyanin
VIDVEPVDARLRTSVPMRRQLVAFVLLAAPAVAAAPAGAATIGFGDAHGFAYVPGSVRIHPHETVTWSGSFGVHPLRSAATAEPYASGAGTGATLDHTFDSAGVFRFYCAMHGVRLGENQVGGMSGEVVVTDNTPPVAAFTQSATQVASGTRVSFDGTSSHDAEGPVSYAWDLDDDGDSTTAPARRRAGPTPARRGRARRWPCGCG